MPIRSLRQTRRFAQMCGARIPRDLAARMEAAQEDATAVRRIGIEHATLQCCRLLEADVAGLHFYTLNHSTATRAIYGDIRGMLGAPVARA